MSIFVVRKGDSLYQIARRYGLSAERLVYINQLNEPSRLSVGQALVIPDDASPTAEIEVNGYAYPNISQSTLNETLPYLTYFCPFSNRADTEGNIIPLSDEALIGAAYARNAAPLLTVTNIGANGGFSGDITHAIFNDEAVQNRFFENMQRLLREKGYYGVNFNFEYIYPYDRLSYNNFLRRAESILHPNGWFLSTAIAPKNSDEQQGLLYSAIDYAAHGQYCDRVVIMTYEWGYTYSSPRAVSPVNLMRRVLDYAVTTMPAGKILLGFSNYGYNWTLPWKQGNAAAVISNAAAANLANSVFAEIKFDNTAQAPYFNYTAPDGVRHEVWFEDGRSVKARLKLVLDYNLAGISYWTVNPLFRGGLEMLNQTFGTEKIV